MTRSFNVFFDLRLNKRLSKQSRGFWFETSSRSLWRHYNVQVHSNQNLPSGKPRSVTFLTANCSILNPVMAWCRNHYMTECWNTVSWTLKNKLLRYVNENTITFIHENAFEIQWRGAFNVFFDLRLNKRLSKQSRGLWFETPSRSLWRHYNVQVHSNQNLPSGKSRSVAFLTANCSILNPVMAWCRNHYMTECWNTVSWTLKNKLLRYVNENTITFIHENAFEIQWRGALMFSLISAWINA